MPIHPRHHHLSLRQWADNYFQPLVGKVWCWEGKVLCDVESWTLSPLMRRGRGGGWGRGGQDNYSTRNSTSVNKAGRAREGPCDTIDEQQLEQVYVFWPPVCRWRVSDWAGQGPPLQQNKRGGGPPPEPNWEGTKDKCVHHTTSRRPWLLLAQHRCIVYYT